MKKQWRTPIILASALVLLLGVWWLSTLLPGEVATETTTTTTTAPMVFEAAAADVASIAVHNTKADLTLLPQSTQNTDGSTSISWQLDSTTGLPFSSTKLASIANAMLDLSASRVIAENATDLAAFGLAQPSTQITITLKNGAVHVISLGNELASGSGVYASVDSNGTIYAISSTTAGLAQVGLLELLDQAKTIGIDAAELIGLNFDRAKDNLSMYSTCVYEETTIGDTTSSFFDFKLTRPLAITGNPDKLTTLATEALKAAAAEFVEINPADLTIYGLDQPQYTIALTTATKTVTLKIGKQVGDSYYMISDALPAVFKVSTSTFSVLDMPAIEMVDRQFMMKPIWTVDRVVVDIPGASFTAEIAQTSAQIASDEGVTFRLDGADARIFSESDSSLFTAFYQRIIGLRMAGIEAGVSPANTRDGSIVFSIKADPSNNVAAHNVVIEFARRDDYTDYVFIDGVYAGYYIDRALAFTSEKLNAEGIVVAYDMMKYAMAHAVNGVFDTQEGYQLD